MLYSRCMHPMWVVRKPTSRYTPLGGHHMYRKDTKRRLEPVHTVLQYIIIYSYAPTRDYLRMHRSLLIGVLLLHFFLLFMHTTLILYKLECKRKGLLPNTMYIYLKLLTLAIMYIPQGFFTVAAKVLTIHCLSWRLAVS